MSPSVHCQTKLLTVVEVLEQLGICRATFYEIVKRGELPLVKLGSSSRVRASDLQKYVDELPQLHDRRPL
jgi:excisionase family DNA binding protein